MFKHGLEGINIKNPIADKMPKIIDYFVEFYGENHREEIEEKLNKALYIFVERNAEGFQLDHYFDGKFEEIAKLFLEEVHKKFDINLYKVGPGVLEFLPKLEEWQNEIKPEQLSDVAEFMDYFIIRLPKEVNATLTPYNFLENYSIPECAAFIKDFIGQVNKIYKESFEKDIKYLESEREKYVKEQDNFLPQFRERVYKKTLSLIEMYVMGRLHINLADEEKVEEILPVIYDFILKNEKFYTEYDEERFDEAFAILDSIQGKNMRKSSRITLKKASPMLRAYIQEYLDIQLSDLDSQIEETENYKLIKEYYDNPVICDFYKSFLLGDFETGGANIGIPRKWSNEKYKSVCINNSITELSDLELLHEMNHIVGYTDAPKEMKSDKAGIELSRKDGVILNETLNEFIAYQICNKMEKDGFLISTRRFNDHCSVYAYLFPVVQKFYEENIDFLKECVICPDINPLFKKFGKENVFTLAKILDDVLNLILFDENLLPFIIDNENLFEFAKTHDTRKLNKNQKTLLRYFKKAKEVLDKMQDYKNSSGIETNFDEEKEIF